MNKRLPYYVNQSDSECGDNTKASGRAVRSDGYRGFVGFGRNPPRTSYHCIKPPFTTTRGFAPRSVWGIIALRALFPLQILSFSYYPQRRGQRRSLSRCLSAVAAAKPACIEPAAGNRLADIVACVDHAQTTPSQPQIRHLLPSPTHS